MLAPLSVAILMGCNGGGNTTTGENNTTTTGDPNTLQGTFIDEPVKGLHYKTVSQEGCTDEDGTFYYLSDESIVFSLGKCDNENNPVQDATPVIIGESDGMASVTPFNLTITSGTNEGKPAPAYHVAQILKSLTTDNTQGSQKLDLSGIKFNGEGLDVVDKYNSLFKMNDGESSLIVSQDLFNELAQINSSHPKGLKHDNFLTEETVESELAETISKMDSNTFTPSMLANKFFLQSSDSLFKFSTDSGEWVEQGFSAHGDLTMYFNDDFGEAQEIAYIWGIDAKGNLHAFYDEKELSTRTNLSLLSQTDTTLSVRINNVDSGTMVENWKKSQQVKEVTGLNGTYQSENHTFTLLFSDGKLDFKDVESRNSETVELIEQTYTITEQGNIKVALPDDMELFIIRLSTDNASAAIVALQAGKVVLIEMVNKV